MPLILSAQVEAKSRKSRYSFDGNQPGVLPQAVTTIWRTELGTTLLNGFNSTTDLSAYFHYLRSYQSAMSPARNAKFLTMVKKQVDYDATLWEKRDAERDKRFEAKLKRQAQQRGYKLVPIEENPAA
jgi:hypothetical protein